MTEQDKSEQMVRALLNQPDRRKPEFIETPDMDKMLSAVLRLAMEISVLRDRIDTHELLAAKHSLYSDDDVENFEPDDAARAARSERRSRLIENILRDLS